MRKQAIEGRPRKHDGIAGAVLLVIFFLSGSDAFAAPSVTASPNPVGVVAGQTKGTTTITWNADGLAGFVWMSVDGGDETQLAANATKGSIEIEVTLGKAYELRLYTADKERILARVKVSVRVQPPPPSSVGGPLKNSRNEIEDLDVKRTMKGLAFGQKPRELRCRGSANLKLDENGSRIIYMYFDRAASAVDPAGRSLAPGQCGWTERAFREDEKNLVYQASDRTAKEDVWKIDLSVSDSDRFPKYDFVRSYMSDSNNYWSFFVRDIGRGEWWAEYSRRWIPIKTSTIKKGPRVTAP